MRIFHAETLRRCGIDVQDYKAINSAGPSFAKLVLKELNYPRPCWVSLVDETSQRSVDAIRAGLGITHLSRGTPLLSISYTIHAQQLHVPTVIDAGLYRGFVPKPGNMGLPRAWNWESSDWGMVEMVHENSASIGDPELNFLGTIELQSKLPYEGLSTFELPLSARLEHIASQALRQTVAHRELEPFLSGKSSILEIDAREFEHFVARLFARQGYQTTVTKASRDGGFDVIAMHGLDKEDGLLIQAKQTKGTVGIRVIRELAGARLFAENGLHQHMLVVATTGRFSSVARDLEQQFPLDLALMDYDRLQSTLRLVKRIGVADIVRDALTSRDLGVF